MTRFKEHLQRCSLQRQPAVPMARQRAARRCALAVGTALLDALSTAAPKSTVTWRRLLANGISDGFYFFLKKIENNIKNKKNWNPKNIAVLL